MRPVYYTKINPDTTPLTGIFRVAHALGYELIQFPGWTDADLGPSGQPGPRRTEANENGRRIAEIVDALGDYTEIIQVSLSPSLWSEKFNTYVARNRGSSAAPGM